MSMFMVHVGINQAAMATKVFDYH